ncbi:MAG: hypothetical protein AAFX93_20010 [Verrucomicrobiota bacterium]
MRLSGRVVDSAKAVQYALDFRAGKELPDWVNAYGDTHNPEPASD